MISSSLLLLALAQAPTAQHALLAYDALMGPPTFQATTEMTAHREDGSTRTYKLSLLKSGAERSRIWFQAPASAKGQEILRVGENSWIYMPNLKRAVRLANRDSFQGGDFNNADVLRSDYAKDYDGKVSEDPARPDTWLLSLTAKSEDASYDAIKLWVLRAPLGLPVRGEFYSASGKLLRSADFLEVKEFSKGLKRPARIKMRNEVATERWSELFFSAIDTSVQPAVQRFVVDDLGR
jgi:outer membrane lipoprotein-sorting protein